MAVVSMPRRASGLRKLGPVPWYQDGCRGLTARAGSDVPSFDDPMIRGALARGALGCGHIAGLERALNRELWPLGYVAHLEQDVIDRSVVYVDIASSR